MPQGIHYCGNRKFAAAARFIALVLYVVIQSLSEKVMGSKVKAKKPAR
jgi:hypothetical protein